MALPENLKTARLNLGLTLEEVAKRLNVGYPAVYKWENGIMMPNAVRIVELAEIFGTTAEKLVKGK